MIKRHSLSLPRFLESLGSKDQPLSLRTNLLWTIIGNVGYATCQWGMLVVLANLGNPELVGRFALGLSISAPIMLLSNLNLRAVQATDAAGRYAFDTYLGLRLVTTIAALLVVVLVILWVGYQPATALVIFLVGLAKAAESMSDAFYGLLQRHEQMDHIAISMLARGVLSLLALGVGVWLTDSVAWGAFLLLLTWVFVLFFYDVRKGTELHALRAKLARPRLRPDFDWARLMPLAWLALPLGLVQMLISFNTTIPRYVLEYRFGEHELGIYSALDYLAIGGGTVIVAVGHAVTPRLATYYEGGEYAAFNRLLYRVFLVCGGLGVAAIVGATLLGGPALKLLYTAEYADEVPLLQTLAVVFAIGALVSVAGFGITAARMFRVQVPLVALSVATTAIGSWVLIPRHGLLGAGYAQILAMTFWLLASVILLWWLLRVHIRQEGRSHE